MYMLLPKDYFLEIIGILGGLDNVKSNFKDKAFLAYFFNVKYRLVEVRINDILLQEKHQEEEQPKIIKLKR